MKRMDNDYNNYNKSKRLKLQQVDDIWGDDPAIEDVDRCIDLATQICSQTQGPSTSNNYSIINYECFKQKSNLVASTQENDTKRIIEENETKKGEIAFLRAQLKQSQNQVSKEKMERLKIMQQNQEVWNEKLNLKNKEVASLKCENELKTLEAANLRQKLNELKKMYNCNVTIWNDDNKTQNVQPQLATSKNSDMQTDHSVVYSYKNVCYPCKEILPQFEGIKVRDFSLNDILKIANYTEEELNSSEDFLGFLLKFEIYIKEYLIHFLIKLIKTKTLTKSQNNDNCTSFYLNTTNDVEYNYENIFSPRTWSEFEKETELRRLIAIAAYLCENSTIFYNILLKQLNGHLDAITNELEQIKQLDFLQVILQITVHIKNNCLTEQLCGFLASTLKLLTVLIDRAILPTINNYKIIFEIFKEILFAQPNEPVLQYICYFLKYISEHGCFMSMLCTKKKSNQTVIKDGLLYFTNETCTLKILVTIIETCKLQIDTACNLMHFLQNLVTCNVDWMYQQNNQSCGCLSDIYGLGITILYKSLEKCSSHKNAFLSIFHVGLLFLHILTVRIPDLVAKSSRLYSQYQTIIKYMYKMRYELLLTNAHETMLDDLITQLNCDTIQNETTNNISMINSYNCTFINF